MTRTHRRHAIRAAIAAVLVVALTVGAGVAAAAPAKPTIKLGTKDFPEEFILGQLYKQALEAKGYKVQFKKNIGSTEIIKTALYSGKIDMYPEYTGTILSVIFKQAKSPANAQAAYNQAKAKLGTKGFTLFNMTPFSDTDAIAVLKSTAAANGLKTISDLSKLGDKLTISALPEFETRSAGLVGMKTVYGVTNGAFKPIPQIDPYATLDNSTATAVDVFSTDPQLATGKYTVLSDPKFIFGFQNVAPIVSKKLAAKLGPSGRRIIDAVSAKLTLPAIIAMNKAVSVDKKSDAAVAKAFLKANKLA